MSDMSDPKRALCTSDDAGTHVAADASSRSVRIVSGLLFIAGGLFGLLKLGLYDFDGCQASEEGLGFHPLGWSAAMSFMCRYSWQSAAEPGGWQVAGTGDVPGAMVFLIVASCVLVACGIVCLVTSEIRRAGIVVGILLTAFTCVACVVAVIGMAELNSLTDVNWFDYAGGYFFCVQYVILLAVPVIFISLMTSTSVVALRMRRMALILAMAFGAIIFSALSVLMDFSVEPELGNVFLIAALLVLAYAVRDLGQVAKDPARRATAPQHQADD